MVRHIEIGHPLVFVFLKYQMLMPVISAYQTVVRHKMSIFRVSE